MNIGVNSRIYELPNTGIQYFIKNLYEKLLIIDKRNKYSFFQTNSNKIIGSTKLIQLPSILPSIIKIFLFDNLLINYLAKKDKVNIFHGPANILPLYKLSNTKYIVTIHDLAFLQFPDNYPWIFRTYYKYNIKRTLKIADSIIAVSQNTKNDIIKFYNTPKKKIKVVYQGIGDIFFQNIKKERLVKEKYFFSLTTHPKRKNIFNILNVISKSTSLKQYMYVIAGLINDQEVKELEEYIKKLEINKNVKILGYVSEYDLINLYQNAEFFIYPSFYEGFGFPVLEAMACRCPVITSNNSSLKEIMINKEWLINPSDLKDISLKIQKVLTISTKERQNLISDNYKFAKSFNWKKTAESYMNIFNTI